jgi:hypothetical protein
MEYPLSYNGMFERVVKKESDGLLAVYGFMNGNWVLTDKLYQFDHKFFKIIDDAMLWLNGYEAAYKLGYKEPMAVYRMLVTAEAAGNEMRSGNKVTEDPLLFFDKESFVRMAKLYNVKYL